MKVSYQKVKKPALDCTNVPVMLTDETIKKRYKNVYARMQEEEYDVLVVYADLEHGNNFEYLTGFLPRFEEALLVMHKNGTNYLVMGNENLNKVSKARIPATAVHCPYFSLPNQPMKTDKSFPEILKEAGLRPEQKVGIVGWKLFTSKYEDNKQLFDVPFYTVDTIRNIVGNFVYNASDIFLGPKGVRRINNVNEIEHYEFGAALASDCMLKAMDQLEVGSCETEIGQTLNALGQKNSVVTVASSGPRFVQANLYPTENKVKLGDPISLTIGYKGGLSSRAGYAVHDETELDKNVQEYLDVLVKPYFVSIATWLTKVHCGMQGKDIYDAIEEVMPKEKYHWSLCPGHLTADEEWLSSPIYEGSCEVLESGMIFQTDIIPSIPGYGGTSVESTVLLADKELRKEIQEKAPAMWQRMMTRRDYVIDELHIPLHEDLLPMCSTLAYLRPYLLNKEYAMTLK